MCASTLTRRTFLEQGLIASAGVGVGAAGSGASQAAALSAQAKEGDTVNHATPIPLKIGHRAASMKMVGDFDVFKVARQMSGLMGVELQVTGGNPNLRDWDAVRRYKREALRWGMMIPSLAGTWDRGVSMLSGKDARDNLVQAVRVAEFLGAGVILAAFFKEKAPDMSDESSYGPAVDALQAAAPQASEAGVVIGLENSLSPADNKKLVDLVAHPAVKVYYDPHNMAFYGHGVEAVPGIKLLGKERICQVHVKNADKPIEEPGLVDWTAAFKALNNIGYENWFVFESQHDSREALIEDTARNISFMEAHCNMPMA